MVCWPESHRNRSHKSSTAKQLSQKHPFFWEPYHRPVEITRLVERLSEGTALSSTPGERCERCPLGSKKQQEFRLLEWCSSTWEVANSQISHFAQDAVGLIVVLGVVWTSFASWHVEEHRVPSSCRCDKLQESWAAATGPSSLLWTWSSALRRLFLFELSLTWLEGRGILWTARFAVWFAVWLLLYQEGWMEAWDWAALTQNRVDTSVISPPQGSGLPVPEHLLPLSRYPPLCWDVYAIFSIPSERKVPSPAPAYILTPRLTAKYLLGLSLSAVGDLEMTWLRPMANFSTDPSLAP